MVCATPLPPLPGAGPPWVPSLAIAPGEPALTAAPGERPSLARSAVAGLAGFSFWTAVFGTTGLPTAGPDVEPAVWAVAAGPEAKSIVAAAAAIYFAIIGVPPGTGFAATLMTVRGTGSSERLVKAHSALRSMQRLSFVVDDRIPAIWCAIIFSSDLRAQRRPSRASSCCCGTKAGGKVAHRVDRGVAGAFGETDLPQRCVALRDADAETEFTSMPPQPLLRASLSPS